ncbi:YceG family protein [Bacillus haynesii]|uniref:YceG family protein n=1 Tax=Bacillus haynesii TaxID=1925021 RepID=UPI00227E61A7|nr:YceG family protein [Bacillus haynesii]MCY7751905.1 YceG family protein [Bacillus haynesii]MCY7914137.1 YceG family protein [Bacillus haynesii]MCY7925613.1 YceG family protein [Bacillus haynesii]MCY8000632.1 YceG family protein [Bacillus haynesii]MCY8046709.1 YceG family protein [Bacillus haynesii]
MNQEINIQNALVNDDEWKQIIKKPLPERTPDEKNGHLTISRLAGRILGTPHDETDYYIYLHELYVSGDVHVLSETLDKTISPERFQAIQRIHMVNQKEKGLSVNRFAAFLDGEQLIPKHPDAAMHRHLRKALIEVLQMFQSFHEKGLNDPDFRRVLLDLVKWMGNHLEKWLKGADCENAMPKVVWYGDTTKSQRYFLYYLMLVGCDVLLFHPEGKDEFRQLDPEQKLSFVFTYPGTSVLEPFPTEKPQRKSTVAYRSAKELDTVLHNEDSLMYKPWQFREHTPVSVTLKTTYDELFLIAKERAFIRPNFQASQSTVNIPNLFAMVMGVSSNEKEYWDRLQTLTEYKESHTIRRFPFTKEETSNYQFHYSHALDQAGMIDPDRLMESNIWRYKHLPEGVQRGIAQAVSRMCKIPKLLALNNENTAAVQLYLFTQAVQLPAELLNMIQTFDYSQTVPKLILYHTEQTGTLTRSDAAALLLLNEIGIDIIIYNPPGHKCIDHYIDGQHFDTHWLDDMSFNQEFKEPSIVRKFINKIF